MSEKEPPEVSVGGGLDQKSANYGLSAKCGPWLVSIKFCWQTAMPTHFYITYGAFTTRVQLSCPDRDRLTQKAELLYSWPFGAWCRGVRAELGAQEEVRLWGN